MFEILINILKKNGIDCQRGVPLSTRSTFRVGGVGALGAFPKSAEELAFCLAETRGLGLPCFTVGKGSNILFLDGEISGFFIFTEGLREIRIDGATIYAEAGATLSSVAAAAAEASLCGFEFAKGIPGSVGGAVYMNAGAYGGQMSDAVVSTDCYDAESQKILTLAEHEFSYRQSIYQKDPSLVCLGAEIRLSQGNKNEIYEKMREFATSRREKQPLEYPSAGSYFKRPKGHFAGKLIEDCGLKGLTVGGAAVSEKHAGFIVNRGGATASDILELEKRITDAVYESFGVKLEREVRVIG